MVVYNVTVNIEEDVEKDWINWMKTVHIPEVMQTGCFNGHKFLRLLNENPEATGVTYAIQYFLDSVAELNNYLDNYASDLQAKSHGRYPNKFVAFRTFLEEV